MTRYGSAEGIAATAAPHAVKFVLNVHGKRWVGSKAMLWLMRILREISRARRRIFGKQIPHWLKDALSLFGFVNFLDMAPTLIAITLSPSHFYSRLPQYVRSKDTWFKTPLKFFTSGLALVVALLFFFDAGALNEFGLDDKTEIARYLALICITCPITIPLACLMFRAMLAASSAIPGSSSLPKTIRINLLIPLSLWTYIRLDYRSFVWAIFYFGIYFYICTQILQIIALYELYAIGLFDYWTDECMSFVSKIDPNHTMPDTEIVRYLDRCHKTREMLHQDSPYAKQTMVAGFWVMLGLAGYGILINPYLCLLRACAKIPTKRMHRSDCHTVKDCIEAIIAVNRKKEPHVKSVISRLEQALDRLEMNGAKQDRKARNYASKYSEILSRERYHIRKRVLGVDKLRAALEREPLPSIYADRIGSIEDHLVRLSLCPRDEVHLLSQTV
jgi:hypothetical protein